MDVLAKKLTYKEFLEIDFPDNETALYELINGNIVRRSSPTVQHQRVSMKLAYFLHAFVTQNKLGEVLAAPLDVVLDNENLLQPDIIFIKNEREFVVDEIQSLIVGTPDLVVEILSPSTMRNDRGEKMEIYERFAVREFWLVDPKNNSIEVYQIQNNRYKLVSFAVETGLVQSNVLPNFEIEISEVF